MAIEVIKVMHGLAPEYANPLFQGNESPTLSPILADS